MDDESKRSVIDLLENYDLTKEMNKVDLCYLANNSDFICLGKE
jgi:hypothetical protein